MLRRQAYSIVLNHGGSETELHLTQAALSQPGRGL